MGRRNYERGSAARRPRLIILALRLCRTASRVSCGRRPKTPPFHTATLVHLPPVVQGKKDEGEDPCESRSKEQGLPRGVTLRIKHSHGDNFLVFRAQAHDAWPSTGHLCRRTCLQQKLCTSTLVMGPQVHRRPDGSAAPAANRRAGTSM